MTMGRLQSVFRILLALRGLLRAVNQWSRRRKVRSEINLDSQSGGARILARVRAALGRHDRRNADRGDLRRKNQFFRH